MKNKPVNPLLPPPYNKMTARELDAEVERFDRESPEGKPLTESQQMRHRRARRRVGRPIIGKGAERITITMERGLLRAADTFARKQNMSRSELIANGNCADGIDNDGNGLIDAADPGCRGVTPETPAAGNCNDGVDNDGDGLVDTLDPGCQFGQENLAAGNCTDGIDNDGDGLIDGADPGCQPTHP